MHLDIQTAPRSGTTQRVALFGRLDTHSYPQLDADLAPMLDGGDPPVMSLVLDLAGLNYISSAGIRSIFKARKALTARNGKLLVVNPQPQIQKVFDVVKAVPDERHLHLRGRSRRVPGHGPAQGGERG